MIVIKNPMLRVIDVVHDTDTDTGFGGSRYGGVFQDSLGGSSSASSMNAMIPMPIEWSSSSPTQESSANLLPFSVGAIPIVHDAGRGSRY